MLHRRWLVASLLFGLVAMQARAQTVQSLHIESSSERMRVDGSLSEWRGAHFTELGHGDARSLRYALAEADLGLYIGAEVRDDIVIAGERGDGILVALAMPVPDSNKWVTSELALHPGETGKSQAVAKLTSAGRTRKDDEIQVVEGPRKAGGGYVLEAFVPWKVIDGADMWEQGRGVLSLVDQDGKGAATVVASAPGTGNGMPPVAVGVGNRDLLGMFQEALQLKGVAPKYDFRSNVSGDARPERVMVVDRYVVVYGAGYKDGTSYNYFALPYSGDGGLKNATLADLTGDGRNELLVTVRQQNQFGMRDAWLVLSLDREAMSQTFGIEVRKEAAGGFVENQVSLLPKERTRSARIEQKLVRSQGLDAGNYREQPATDITPILLPWGAVEARRFAFDGNAFSLVDETKRKGASLVVQPATASEAVPVTPTHDVGAGDVLAAFKQQAKLAADAQPSRTLRANVLPGSDVERIDVFGSHLVFTGPDVAGGRGFVSYAVPVTAANDLRDVRTGDVTADGRDELLVRLRQSLTGGANVERELLLVVSGEAEGRFTRLLLVEIARKQGDAAVDNKAVAQGGALIIEPGKARGWSQATYPFKSDPVGGAARLLLPWSDRTVRYHRQGDQLVPVP